MPWSLKLPSSPIFSPKNGSSLPSSPRINGSQAPPLPSPSSLALSSPKSSLSLSSTSVTTPQSPSSSSSLKSSLSIFVPNQQPSSGVDAAPSVVKRKRPARIEIPTPMTADLGFVAETPRGEEEVLVDGEGYSVYCKRGRRGKMEDRYSAVVDFIGDSKQAFFGVFDGHGGSKAAEFAANNLVKKAMAEISKRRGVSIEEAIRKAYLTTDMDFRKKDIGGGTCCVTAMIHKGDLVVSNAGDCRAVLSRSGVAEALTSDHKPSRQDERDRIEALVINYFSWCASLVQI
ncbi:hypothetical protein CRYUN_Cryun01aG0028200 [Craigia yunnanensis]